MRTIVLLSSTLNVRMVRLVCHSCTRLEHTPRPALVVAYDAYKSCMSCYALGQISGGAAHSVTACPWTASAGMHAMSGLLYKHIPRHKTSTRYKRAVASHDVQLATPCKWHIPGCAGALLGNCQVAASRLLAHACKQPADVTAYGKSLSYGSSAGHK